jgi:membrane protease YdiL (CAAX protease family)
MEMVRKIDIYLPGNLIEREMPFRKFFKILLFVGLAFGATVGLTMAILLILIPLGFVTLNPLTLDIYFAPWSFLFLTLASYGFIIPPLYYIWDRKLSRMSIGLFIRESFAIETVWGLVTGVFMLIANLAITWFVVTATGIELDDSGLFFAFSELEVIAWVIVMFVCVGLSEELLFRGFLQRRVSMFFKDKTRHYYIIALVLTSFIFAALHLDLIGLPSRFILGMLLGDLAKRRGYSVVAPSVAHGFNNAAVIILAFFGF